MATTDHLAMPLLSAGQTSPEVSVNEALRILDALVPYPIIENVGHLNPASLPDPIVVGGVYFVDGTGAGAWTGFTRQLVINLGTVSTPVWHGIPNQKSMLGFVKKDNTTAVNRLQIRTSEGSATWANF